MKKIIFWKTASATVLMVLGLALCGCTEEKPKPTPASTEARRVGFLPSAEEEWVNAARTAEESSSEALSDAAEEETEQPEAPARSTEALPAGEEHTEAMEQTSPADGQNEEASPAAQEEGTPADPSSDQGGYTLADVVFIGDSRTLSLGSGGSLEYRLLPEDCIYATWGGTLTDANAAGNAGAAASQMRPLAVFWYGINDVQVNPNRDDAEGFLANYSFLIDTYREINPEGRIIILSILSTSPLEHDYYDGQEENIRRYNEQLALYCRLNGFTYLDITGLFTGDDCLAEGDYIHFSRAWYEERFLPTVLPALGIS